MTLFYHSSFLFQKYDNYLFYDIVYKVIGQQELQVNWQYHLLML